MRFTQFSLLFLLVAICCRSYDPHEVLSSERYDSVLIEIAPYVIKKPDEFSYKERFQRKSQPFYWNFIKVSAGELTYYLQADTATHFFFSHRDLTSLYEHYRGLGGYYKTDKGGNIIYMNILYHTPRLLKEEMEERGKLLFDEMVSYGNVNKYLGDKSYIDTPNNDFYYNTTLNRWDYTENSSWKFLEEARQKAEMEKKD